MRFETLPQWLHWQENLHFTEIDPGLVRVGKVWQRMEGKTKLPFTVVTIAGTNGKGSSVAMLASILQAAGYKVGTYTSPHLLHYNERICIDNIPCEDDFICRSFDQIDEARDEISLSYFEFATLAAANIFCLQHVDIAIFEVGMGGRLDATNLFDCDIALITPVGLDHINWLGTNREAIGFEKAGIMRPNTPVVCSEKSPPQSVLDHAAMLQAPVYQAGKDFDFNHNKDNWHWESNRESKDNLALPALLGLYQLQNAAAVLQVVELLKYVHNYVILDQHINQGLETVKLAGRFQKIAGDVEQVFDVTHNQQGAKNLAKLLAETPCKGRTIAILAMLKDKDPSAVVHELKSSVDVWYVAGLTGSRGMSSDVLAAEIEAIVGEDNIIRSQSVNGAYEQAMTISEKGDRVLVFGSFYTVELALRLISAK